MPAGKTVYSVGVANAKDASVAAFSAAQVHYLCHPSKQTTTSLSLTCWDGESCWRESACAKAHIHIGRMRQHYQGLICSNSGREGRAAVQRHQVYDDDKRGPPR